MKFAATKSQLGGVQLRSCPTHHNNRIGQGDLASEARWLATALAATGAAAFPQLFRMQVRTAATCASSSRQSKAGNRRVRKCRKPAVPVSPRRRSNTAAPWRTGGVRSRFWATWTQRAAKAICAMQGQALKQCFAHSYFASLRDSFLERAIARSQRQKRTSANSTIVSAPKEMIII
jgi:hypothetical protein